MIEMWSFFRKLSKTLGVSAALLRVVLNLGAGVLAAIANIFYTFGNVDVPIGELLGNM